MVVMAHMQRAGHRPIAIIGGGTAMREILVATDMRKILTHEQMSIMAQDLKFSFPNLLILAKEKH